MNSLYYQNIVNRIEKEIADLQTKIATESKKEVDKNRQIDLVNRSITKSTSLSMLQSKRKRLSGRACNGLYNIYTVRISPLPILTASTAGRNPLITIH